MVIPRWYEIPSSGHIVDNQQGALSCEDLPYSQAQLRIDVEHSDFVNATPGTYSGQFSVDLGNGSSVFIGHQNVEVTVPLQAKISNLSDIDLTGSLSGGIYYVSSNFCTFVTAARGFDLTVSGQVDNGSRFAMAIPSTSHRIEYRIYVYQGSNYQQLEGNGTLTGFTGHKLENCGGINNINLLVYTMKTAVDNKPAGSYQDVLTMTVIPK